MTKQESEEQEHLQPLLDLDTLRPAVGWTHPSRMFYRAVVLILICNITFGSYYCFDLPGAVKGDLFLRFPAMTQLQYNLLYSLYAWPNTVQVFFGGYIIDRYLGVRRGCAICCIVLVAGQALVCLGVQEGKVELLLGGRFLFGIGGETLAVAQSAYAAQWFKGAELATAFGIVLSFSRLGSAVNFAVSPSVVEFADRSAHGQGTCRLNHCEGRAMRCGRLLACPSRWGGHSVDNRSRAVQDSCGQRTWEICSAFSPCVAVCCSIGWTTELSACAWIKSTL